MRIYDLEAGTESHIPEGETLISMSLSHDGRYLLVNLARCGLLGGGLVLRVGGQRRALRARARGPEPGGRCTSCSGPAVVTRLPACLPLPPVQQHDAPVGPGAQPIRDSHAHHALRHLPGP